MTLNNKAYDVVKDVVTLVLPATATLYATIAGIWGLPFSVEVVGTSAAVATFLGAVLKINTVKFAKENTMVQNTVLEQLEQAPAGVTLSEIISPGSSFPEL